MQGLPGRCSFREASTLETVWSELQRIGVVLSYVEQSAERLKKGQATLLALRGEALASDRPRKLSDFVKAHPEHFVDAEVDTEDSPRSAVPSMSSTRTTTKQAREAT
jgi:hypothetical protein